MEKFYYTKEIIDDVTLIKLCGTIDEDCFLKDIFVDTLNKIAIDLSGIIRINSCGIRTWINVLEQLTKTQNVIFIECSPIVIRQFNMIANFGARGVIQSFQLPYYCEACNREYVFRSDTKEFLLRPLPLRATVYSCPTCNGVLEFDDLEEKYFHFLTQYKKL
jgi:anti-anti-sigma regulatory factor